MLVVDKDKLQEVRHRMRNGVMSHSDMEELVVSAEILEGYRSAMQQINRDLATEKEAASGDLLKGLQAAGLIINRAVHEQILGGKQNGRTSDVEQPAHG